ncbi:MAG TPA: NAD(P)/FAD-dependent oxidoreductase [Streptosporangiaceae bacterium]|nr:NAD(P)/FAD-dependent oxidoreductase [Streptosporangiaceae bacterium]
MTRPDAVVVGAGPNGLAAAVTLARAGLTVQVLEGAATPGGGCRTAELTLPGFAHDVCSTVHALAAVSPFFAGSDLAARDVRLLTPKVAAAHPLTGGRATAVSGSVAETAGRLGDDARAYEQLMAGLVRASDALVPMTLAPVRLRALRSLAAEPVEVARFGAQGLLPATLLARRLHTDEGRALLAGMAAHAIRPLTAPLTGAFGLTMLMLAHRTGWPVIEGGSGRLVAAMTQELTERGGAVATGTWIERLADLPPARVVLLDVTPRQVVNMAGDRLPASYRRAMQGFRYGPGACKVDWALDGPVPWQNEVCRETVTVHIGGTIAEISRSEAAVDAGRHPERPFCLIAQPCVVDPGRAPAGKHVLWGYCHVPAGSDVDMSERIEAQVERFAPGFLDLILARSVQTAADMERYNPGYVGGDIAAGANTLRQTVGRPALRWNPYRTPLPGVYLCSGSTPPGGGVHGMCGYWAASTALRDLHVPVPAAASRPARS